LVHSWLFAATSTFSSSSEPRKIALFRRPRL